MGEGKGPLRRSIRVFLLPQGLKYFIILLATLFISFAVAFLVLFRCAARRPCVAADRGALRVAVPAP